MKRILTGIAAAALLAGCGNEDKEPERYTEISSAKVVETIEVFRSQDYLVVEKDGQTVKFAVDDRVTTALREGNMISGKYNEDFVLTDVKVDGFSEEDADHENR